MSKYVPYKDVAILALSSMSLLNSEWQLTIQGLPTIDIVRCKECMNNDINCSGTENWCLHFGYDVEDDDFCSYGERKE